jgi:hypothetical protein
MIFLVSAGFLIRHLSRSCGFSHRPVPQPKIGHRHRQLRNPAAPFSFWSTKLIYCPTSVWLPIDVSSLNHSDVNGETAEEISFHVWFS